MEIAPTLLPVLLVVTLSEVTCARILPYHRPDQIHQISQFPVHQTLPEVSENTVREHKSYLSGSNSLNYYHAYPRHYQNNIHKAQYPEFHSSPIAPKYVKERPTVMPAAYFNPQQDAAKLHKALSSFVDSRTIIDILTNRSYRQRAVIMQHYPELMNDLRWKLSSSFRDLVVTLVTRPESFVVQKLGEALKFSTSIDEGLLVELLSTLNNTKLLIIKNEYRKVYGRELQADMTKFSLNKFTNFFSSYIEGQRDENKWVDHVLATKDAKQLKNSGQLSVDKSSFFRYLMTSRSFIQLNRTFVEYQRITGKSLEHVISQDLSGNVRTELLNIVNSIKNRDNFFSEILYNGMNSFSKRDATLIRIITVHAEVDMGDIKDAYSRMYKTALYTAISYKTSGSFKDALLALIAG